MTKWSLFSLALLTGVGSAVAACSSSGDDSGAVTAGAGGATGGSTSAAGGSTSATGGSGGATDTLYSRLGGHDGIAAAIGAIVTAELMDSDIASYFAPNLKDPKHMPQPADIEECFTDLLGKTAGGPESYPTTTAGGFTCRTMAEAHAALHIGGGTFDNFVTIAGGVLKSAKVADADITTVAGVLTGQKTIIVDSAAPATGPCSAPACDVAAAAGAGGAN